MATRTIPRRHYGTGHKRQRAPGVWELVVNGPRDPISNKRKSVSRTFRGDEASAEDALYELRRRIARQNASGDSTLAEVLDVWLAEVSADLSPTTRSEYERLAHNRIAPAVVGGTVIRRLAPADLSGFYRALHRDGRAVNTVRNVHAVVRGALDYAVDSGWIADNPALKAKLPRDKEKRHIAPPDRATVVRLVNGCADKDFAAFLRLALATGARRGELCALRRSDLDLDAHVVHIRRAIVHDGAGLTEKGTKTYAERQRGIGPNAAVALRTHLERMDERAALAGVKIKTNGYLFSGRADCSTPWRPDTVTTYFVALRNRLGLKGLRLHDLRHVRATQERDAGIPLESVSAGLGHSNTATTATIYAHGTDNWRTEAAAVADDWFD